MKRTMADRSDYNGNNSRNTLRKIETLSPSRSNDAIIVPEDKPKTGDNEQLLKQEATSSSKRCRLVWYHGPEKDLESFHRDVSSPYLPAPLEENLQNMFDDNLKQVNLDLSQLLSIDTSRVLTSCIIYDPTTLNNERQVHLVDKKLIPALLSSEQLNDTQVYILSITALLEKPGAIQIGIIKKIINAVFKSCSRQQKQDEDNVKPVILFIPRLERFYQHLSPAVIPVLCESLLEAVDKPVLVLATASWTSENLPAEMANLFKGRLGCIEHTVTLPSEIGRCKLFSNIFYNHYIFKIAKGKDVQCEQVKELLKELKHGPLKRVYNDTVRVTYDKPASNVLTLYQNLDMVCQLFGSWEQQPSLENGAYSLLLAMDTHIDAIAKSQ